MTDFKTYTITPEEKQKIIPFIKYELAREKKGSNLNNTLYKVKW